MPGLLFWKLCAGERFNNLALGQSNDPLRRKHTLFLCIVMPKRATLVV